MPLPSPMNLLNMFKGKPQGIPSQGQMTPYQDLTAEELASWQGYDPNNPKSRATQYANAVASQGRQPQTQQVQQNNPMMFGQFGDAKKKMGDIWGQIKEGGQNFGKDVTDLYSQMEALEGRELPTPQQNPYSKPQPSQEEINDSVASNEIPPQVDKDGNNIPDLIQAPGNDPSKSHTEAALESVGAHTVAGAGYKGAAKAASKSAAKLGLKGATRAIPGVGWGLAGLDALDYFMPEGYSPYEAFGLAKNNKFANAMSWGNVRDWEK